MDFEAELAVRRHRPKKRRLQSEAKLMARMVLRKTALRVRVWAAPGTSAQVRHQFVQLGPGSSDLDPDKELTGRRSYEQIKLVRRGVLLLFARFQGDMTPEPATLENEARGGRKLTNVFPEKSPPFLGEDSEGSE